MKIDKAIELLAFDLKPLRGFLHNDYNKAIDLGIEALKRVRSDRKINPDLNPYPLPGETTKKEVKS